MADYYSRSVITEQAKLTKTMARVLEARGATLYEEGKENILDGLASGRVPLTTYAIVFGEGWSNCYETADEWAEDYGDEDEDITDEFRELFEMSEENLMHEILKINPDLDSLESQCGWSCSKMRLDGFGGSSVIVTRKGYLYITTTNFEVEEDGTIKPGNVFHAWDEEDDEQSEAA